MGRPLLLLGFLVSALSFAANEEQFTWMDINFCETTVGDALEHFPNATYYGDSGILNVQHFGEALGGEFDELFFYTRPDGIIIGVQINVVSGDFRNIERNVDDLAIERWGAEWTKSEHKHGADSHDYVSWSENDAGTDVHMHLHSSETSPLYKIGHSEDGKTTITVGFKSVTGCNVAKHL